MKSKKKAVAMGLFIIGVKTHIPALFLGLPNRLDVEAASESKAGAANQKTRLRTQKRRVP